LNLREAIVGPDIVVDHAVLVDHGVVVNDGRIEAILPSNRIPSDVARRDLGPGVLTAGLVDIHTHGAGGYSFDSPHPEDHEKALDAYLAAGVTTVLPTIGARPIADMVRSLKTIREVAGNPRLPRVPGAHLEGPYFSKAERGAQDPSALRNPDDGSVDELLEHADIIRAISFAPELPGAVDLTKRLVSLGIVAAAGHSDGRELDLRACQDAGLSHVIHVFSGQSTTVRNGPRRIPGMLEATLASDGLTVEMIGDGKHLPSVLMKLAMRCLPDRLCIVSDSTSGAGMPDGSRYRMAGQEFLVEDGVGVTLDRASFGGSTTLLSAMLRIVAELGTPLPTLVAMATSIPAFAMKLTDVGRIASGYRADFALFDDQLRLRSVGVGGRW
jgi:N-acetylglucosamine-6-phosphate deacetylase